MCIRDRYMASFNFLFCAMSHIISCLFGSYLKVSTDPNFSRLVGSPPGFVPSYTTLLKSNASLTGIGAAIIMLVIVVTGIREIRNKNYELFWFTHQLYVVCYILLIFHFNRLKFFPSFFIWVLIPCLILLCEKLHTLYQIYRCRLKIQTIKHLDSNVIELTLVKPEGVYSYKSGQYSSLCIPKLSKFQWHPFTISSSPSEKGIITFHIAPAGDWTQQLAQLAKDYEKVHKDEDIRVILDGPYGAPAEHYYDHKNLIFVATGVGATPFSSILRQLIHQKKNYPESIKVETVNFFWVIRSPEQSTWLTILLNEVAKENTDGFININVYFTQNEQKNDFRSFFLWNGIDLMKKKGKIGKNELASNVYWGRPNWEKIFESMCLEEGRKEYGVFLCSNSAVSKQVFAACSKYSRLGKRFRFTKEVF
eukprot:TRINITY_DN3187_c0_g1_i3.p1 TRINITY_DN3187_c0_g1~~TRINITY_DN3187_c0_g1_i3.p1  ORF type:complete len:421 (+),score=36.05 TRINITY_DN3187_c0_g1_i3:66-1328(+)